MATKSSVSGSILWVRFFRQDVQGATSSNPANRDGGERQPLVGGRRWIEKDGREQQISYLAFNRHKHEVLFHERQRGGSGDSSRRADNVLRGGGQEGKIHTKEAVHPAARHECRYVDSVNNAVRRLVLPLSERRPDGSSKSDPPRGEVCLPEPPGDSVLPEQAPKGLGPLSRSRCSGQRRSGWVLSLGRPGANALILHDGPAEDSLRNARGIAITPAAPPAPAGTPPGSRARRHR